MIRALVYLAVSVLLIGANAVFVAAEFALVAIEPHQAERAAGAGPEYGGDTGDGEAGDGEAGDGAGGRRARRGDRRSRLVLRAVRSVNFQLSGAQLGITVTSLAVGYLAEPALATLLRPVLRATGLPEAPTSVVALAIALVVATVSQMVFGELVPKNWAISEPMRVGRAVAGPQVLFSRVFSPLIVVLGGVANAILGVFGVRPQDEMRTGRSPDELGSIVRSSARQGTLPTNTAALLGRSLRFGDRDASDVMTPRVRTVWVDADDRLTDLLAVAERSGHSRFPVRGRPGSADDLDGTAPTPAAAREARTGPGPGTGTGAEGRSEDVDGVVGIVHVKDVFRVPGQHRSSTTIREIMVAPLLVPAGLDCDMLLARLRRHGLQLATVIDEYGGTAGIVTLEDLVEELVGEVADEHDLSGAPGVVPDGPGAWLISGLLRPDEAAEATGVRLPEGPYETVAGLVLARLGHLGAVGERVEVDGCSLTITSVDRHRIDRVRLTDSPAGRRRTGAAAQRTGAADGTGENATGPGAAAANATASPPGGRR